jgi:hypothetical protein
LADQQNGTDKEELIRITSLFQPAKTRRGRESIEALPRVEKSLTFYDWMLIAKGTHAHIYRTKQVGLEDSPPYLCVKLFRKGWMTPFNLEKTAYEYLDAAHLERYIPFVFGYDSRTLSQWGLPNVDANDKDLYYAIVMEWIEDAEELSAENITLDSATMILTGLHKIHGAGVLHWDTYKRNMLVVPSENKGLWTDFSCALMGHEASHGQEMESVQWVVLETACSFRLKPNSSSS